MRQGSHTLGRLGLLPLGIAAALLPFAIARVLAASQAPAPVVSTPPAAGTVHPALRDRSPARPANSSWLDRTTKAALRKARPAPKVVRVPQPERPVRVINTRASWYGPGFHGRRTASGERFNKHAMTLASRHLPFGTRVRVVNLRNGKSAIARVNDRGPFRRGYTADLSEGLARRIGMGGLGRVRLEILPKRKTR